MHNLIPFHNTTLHYTLRYVYVTCGLNNKFWINMQCFGIKLGILKMTVGRSHLHAATKLQTYKDDKKLRTY